MDAAGHQKLKELFARARSIPASEREEFVRTACGGDTELAEELTSLLEHDSPETLLANSRTAGNTTTQSRRPIKPMFVQRGRRLMGSRRSLALIAALLTMVTVLLVGWWVHLSIREMLLAQKSEELRAHCRTGVIGIRNLLDKSMSDAQSMGIDPELAESVLKVTREEVDPEKRLLETYCPTLVTSVKKFWGPKGTAAVWNREQVKVLGTANNQPGMLLPTTEHGAILMNRVLKGDSVIFLPNNVQMISHGFTLPEGAGMMSFLVPIRAEAGGKIVGVLLLRNPDLEERFHQLFETSSFLKSGEMYAFTADARMISRPRFREQLEELKLIEKVAEIPATTYVSLKDPGGDLTEGFQPTGSRAALPTTEMVRRAVVERSGVNVQGYRDYRGRMVVGAWEWIKPYEFGVALEMDQREANDPLQILKYVSVLSTTGIGLVLSISIVSLILGRIPLGRVGTQQIGPYTLEREIGSGGMGNVYKAQHELLKRPTALKVMKPELNTETALRRFTREVQFASRLQHPNTVGIYDYGTSEDGRFYYSMEYLVGLSLEEIVRLFGPMSPARVKYLTRQLCGSLQEAHSLGLVHRDIKPQNIMICNCGGETDFVKVLDFGLVKSMEPIKGEHDTTQGEIAGTPRYMAPERLLQPSLADPRVDVYSVGMTMYWMLTGRDAFDGLGVDGLLAAIMTKPPHPFPSEASASPELQQVVMTCLSKTPSVRYGSMTELWAALERVPMTDEWTADDAYCWWEEKIPEMLQHPG
ncbi:MAG: serine/threonine protein kinase [Planctomycetaceae bacterium]|nr:serine/threonine protein kinase [Planctomycetaceae bacterium]